MAPEHRDSEVWRLLPNSVSIGEVSDSEEDANAEEGRIDETQFCKDDALSSSEESDFY